MRMNERLGSVIEEMQFSVLSVREDGEIKNCPLR